MAFTRNPKWGLNDKQMAAIEHYHNNGEVSAYEALLEAGYADLTAKYKQTEFIKKGQKYLNHLRAKTARKNDGLKEKLIEFLKTGVDMDITQFFDIETDSITLKSGDQLKVQFASVRDLKKMPEQLRKLVANIKPVKNGVSVEFYSKLKMIEILNSMNGYNAAKQMEHTGKDGDAIAIFKVGDTELEF